MPRFADRLALTAAAILLASPLAAQTDRAAADSTILTVTGTATRALPANSASLTASFDGKDTTMSLAAQRVAARAEDVRRALEKLGIPRDSVVSASSWYWWRERVSSEPGEVAGWDTVWVGGGPGRPRTVYSTEVRRRTRWRVNDRLQILVGNPALVGKVFDTLLALDIAEISDIRFTRTREDGLADSLVQEAVRDARRRAELMANASGMRLGRMIELSTREFPRSYYGERDDWALGGVTVSMAGSAATGETQIRPANLRVSTTVYTRWRLEPR